MESYYYLEKEEDEGMGRHKMCPKCGSKNINYLDNPKKCHNYGHTWTTDSKRHRGAKKDKVRFR